MRIPQLDLVAQYKSIKKEIDETILKVLDKGEFILGQEVKALEESIANFVGVKHAIGVASGTDALLLSLMAIDIKPGDEVITTPFTFFATAGSIARLGARPIFVDIELDTYNIAPNKLENLLNKYYNPRMKAIIPVHLYGQCTDMDTINELAKKYNLRVIEDAAQSIGATYKGKQSGSLGDIGCFSFFPSKNLGAYGDGGMVVTNDDEIAEKIRLLRVHGAKPKYYHSMVGINSRLDEIQAAILNVKFKHLKDWITERRNKASIYDSLISKSLQGQVVIPHEAAYNYHTYHQYTIRVLQRDDLKQFLSDSGIGTAIYYPLPLHLQKCFENLGYKIDDFSISERASKEVLSLPIYPELKKSEQVEVVEKIKEFFEKEAR